MITRPSEIIREKFQLSTLARWLDMSCRLHQRVSGEKWGVGQKFIHFQKLCALTFLGAKFQVKRTILNFGGFFGAPLDDWGPGDHTYPSLKIQNGGDG